MTANCRAQIADSWRRNAAAWTELVRAGGIESRRLATNAAIIDAIRALAPARLLDVGCGEGWLCRALVEDGIDAVGIDGSRELIAAARQRGAARFEVMDYGEADAIAALGRFDAIVCNFALLDDDPAALLRVLVAMLEARGALLIQTVHPWAACGDGPYRDGWRKETFAAFGAGFPSAMPWYFRTLESWIALFKATTLSIARLQEPIHPERGTPLSLLFTLVAGHATEPARMHGSPV